MYFFTTTLISLTVLRFIHGIGFGMVTTSTGTIVASIIPNGRKGEGMGYYGLMMNISMALGPFVGLLAITQWGSSVMFIVSAVSVVIGTITGFLISLPKEEIKVATEKPVKQKGLKMKDLIEMSALPISLVSFFFALVYASIVSFVSVYARRTAIDRNSQLFLYCLRHRIAHFTSIYRKMV